MTLKQTSRERAQGWMAITEQLVTAASEAAEANLNAARRTAGTTACLQQAISPSADPRQQRTLGVAAICAQSSWGEARSESMVGGLSLPDVRLEKVLRLRQAIASGEYHVSSADVADKLIGNITRGSGPDERN